MRDLANLSGKSLVAASLAVAPLLLGSAGAFALESIELLGKNVFFDKKLSIPANKQSCASCHDPKRGWVLPNSKINLTTVVAPGAKPHALGSLKPPANAYASFSPPFRNVPLGGPPGGPPVLPWLGGNFWDGRAEGCGALSDTSCPVQEAKAGAVSETIKPADLPPSKQAAYAKYLGPTADQALNPFPNDVEQNIREKNVCNAVKTTKYKDLYYQAFGEAINCNPNPKGSPAYRTSYKRIAVAIAAWQESTDVNSFSSKRDKALEKDGKFPLGDFSDQENLGHDLFYNIRSDLNPTGKRAFCFVCYGGVPKGNSANNPPRGEEPRQLYTDNRYHNIGVPFNREIPGVARGEKTGLRAHIPAVAPGQFKTPTLRNVAKGVDGTFVKAYAHNGYFKSLKSIVHFYNTRDALGPSCDDLGIQNATEKEALAKKCWPEPEFANPAVFVIGNLGLTDAEEDAVVAYLKTLSDYRTPTTP